MYDHIFLRLIYIVRFICIRNFPFNMRRFLHIYCVIFMQYLNFLRNGKKFYAARDVEIKVKNNNDFFSVIIKKM